jgi:hypothetical protein
MSDTDATNALVKTLDPGAEHAWLARMVGTWEGPVLTWFEPGTAPEESVWRARGDSLLGGRFVRLDYQGSQAMGAPHAGVLTFGYERSEKQYNAHWIDSFHTGTAMMLSVGELEGDLTTGDGEINLRGTYAAGAERWGWRTTLRQPSEQELLIVMYNVPPAGQEDRAVEVRLRRVG